MSLDFAKLRETRAAHPEKLAEIYATRSRRDVIQGDGRLFIVAADHPARNAVAVRDNPRAMAKRPSVRLARLRAPMFSTCLLFDRQFSGLSPVAVECCGSGICHFEFFGGCSL